MGPRGQPGEICLYIFTFTQVIERLLLAAAKSKNLSSGFAPKRARVRWESGERRQPAQVMSCHGYLMSLTDNHGPRQAASWVCAFGQASWPYTHWLGEGGRGPREGPEELQLCVHWQPRPASVTLGKFLELSELPFLICKMEVSMAPWRMLQGCSKLQHPSPTTFE